jgi:SAM-dependent methyltransferase
VELREFYEQSYSAPEQEGVVYARWRALGAVAKADHVLALSAGSVAGAQPHARVLDIGCGDGALLAELAQRRAQWRLAGVELAEQAARLAAARCPSAEIRAYGGETLPYGEREFDLAILSHVLEHVPDPLALLREAARVAREVVVEVPLEANLSARRAAKRGIAAEVGHIQRLSRRSVTGLAAAAGMRVAAGISDPLPRDVHTFFAAGGSARAKANAKWLLRRGVHTLSAGAAERLFTVHYACRLEPVPARTPAVTSA